MAAGQTQQVERSLDDDGVGEGVQLLQQREPLEVLGAALLNDLHVSPGAGVQGSLFGDDVAADVGRAGAADGQSGDHDGVVRVVAAHDLDLALAQALHLHQLFHAGHCLFVHHKVRVLLRQVLDRLRQHLHAQTAGVVVNAAGDADTAHAGVQMGLCGVLGNQDVGRNREHDAVGTFSLTELCKLHACLGGKGCCAEEHGDDLQAACCAILHVGDHGLDDELLLLNGQQGDLTGRAKDEQLVGAVLDLAGNEQLEALDIHLIVLGERSRHCYPGALEIHHDNSLTFKKLKMCIAKSRNALVALKNVISFPA